MRHNRTLSLCRPVHRRYCANDELREHPRTGTGQVEQLKHFGTETWSMRLDREHHLVYEIHDTEMVVLVLSALGHYTK